MFWKKIDRFLSETPIGDWIVLFVLAVMAIGLLIELVSRIVK